MINETTEYLEVFLRNLLLNEKNELHNRNLYISGLLNDTKVDIQDKKVDIESVLSEKGRFDSCESNLPLFGTIYFPTALLLLSIVTK